MNQSCTTCSNHFEIHERDQFFYQQVAPRIASKQFALPLPSQCPDCRRQRRLAFRNENNLYSRPCDLCHKNIISIYSPDKTYPVYCADCFWSERWDAFGYGQDFDFTKPFFEQFQTLFESVPKLGLIIAENENADYNNSGAFFKNCYLCFDGAHAQDSYYGETFQNIRDCVDFLCLQDSELCYQCVNCINSYQLFYSSFSQHCSDSYFLSDCSSCKNCFGCINLHQKQYYIFNQPHSKEDYEAFIANQDVGSHQYVEAMKVKVNQLFSTYPRRAYRGTANDQVSGDNIVHCHQSYDNYDCKDMADCSYCTQVISKAANCQDIDKWGENISWCFNSSGVGNNAQNVLCSYYATFNADSILYSAFCWHGCSQLFGCVGLNRQKSYCILNKQYTKEAYEALVPQIIAHMQKTGEWGQFFPPHLSAFGYNESVAQEYYPLTEEQAKEAAYRWSQYSTAKLGSDAIEANQLPDRITDCPDNILATVITCPVSHKHFRITKPELQFYRTHSIPLPHLHPTERNRYLKNQKNPRQLWQRMCAQCQKSITSSYAPTSAATVYCEECYQKVIV